MAGRIRGRCICSTRTKAWTQPSTSDDEYLIETAFAHDRLVSLADLAALPKLHQLTVPERT